MASKRRLDPLPAALVAIDLLKPEEQKTVLDYLKAKHKAPRKPSTKKTEKGPSRLPDNPDNFLKETKAS